MKTSLKTILFALSFAILAVPAFVSALSAYNPQSVGAGNPEVHIRPNGTMALRSGRVDQIVGSTLYLGVMWGAVPMRFTTKTGEQTSVTKRYGGKTTVSQIQLGDYLDIEGDFFVGSDFFGITARTIKDWSLQEEAGTYSGVILEVLPGETFTLRTPQNQTISVRLSTSSAVSITKGEVKVPFGRLRKGDAVQLASGVYDYSKNTLTADTVTIFQGKTEFTARNFEGMLKQIVSGAIPATLIVTVSGVDYTVKIGEKTTILKKNRATVQLARFVVGDIVRFYGAVRAEEKIVSDALIVDAEIVRNLNL